ncbi:MAG: hypothetical protein ABS81_11490 [Pseudonocardia sp. SCN 72-86]|nr:MAG: hypothetical protein ABS81_11490 [Pseudonocardia sp. SCN 72-86]
MPVPGHSYRVVDVTVPGPERRRLAELGVRRGVVIAVLGKTSGNGRLLGIGQGRLAVDNETAGNLLLEAVDPR